MREAEREEGEEEEGICRKVGIPGGRGKDKRGKRGQGERGRGKLKISDSRREEARITGVREAGRGVRMEAGRGRRGMKREVGGGS